MKRLEHVTLKIPVADYGHIVSALVNLAAIRPSLPVEKLHVRLQVDHLFVGAPEQIKAITDATAALAKSGADLAVSVEAAKPKP